MKHSRKALALGVSRLALFALVGCGAANQGTLATNSLNTTSSTSNSTSTPPENLSYSTCSFITFERTLSEGPNGGNAFQIVATHEFVWQKDI